MSKWQSVQIPAGSKLFKVHNFTYMHGGVIYVFEIDEFTDGTCTGHGEHSTDKSSVIEPVTAKTIVDCLQGLIDRVEKRGV